MKKIDGKALATTVREQVKQEIADSGVKPKLAVLLVGEDAASHIYVNLKEKSAHEAGIETDIRRLPDTTSEQELRQIVETWNDNPSVDAILIQIPLPKNYDQEAIIQIMDPAKDVDGFHPSNVEALMAGTGDLFPPVHEGILRLIAATGVLINGGKAVIIANSEIFANPLNKLLSSAGCFVTKCGPEDYEREILQSADIIIVAVGRANFLKRDMIKSGACIIDVGTNRTAEGKVVGDVDVEDTKDIPGWLSPVPGGVGPMTVAMLLKNTLKLAKRRASKSQTPNPKSQIDFKI